MAVRVEEDVFDKVSLDFDVNGFIGALMGFILGQIPSPKRLLKMIDFASISIGDEARDMAQSRAALDDYISKLEAARDGIRAALKIADEELEDIKRNME